jgi:hypothetical protein
MYKGRLYFPWPQEVLNNMLYLEIFLVMLPIILPSGARAVADLLMKEGAKISLVMKVIYIALLTLCCCAYVPATVYVAKEWGGILATLYGVMGYFLIAFPIVHEGDNIDTRDERQKTSESHRWHFSHCD